MILLLESSTREFEVEVPTMDKLQEKLLYGMKNLNVEKCNFTLKGEAEIMRFEELSCLFG